MADNLCDRIAAVLNRHKPDGDRYNEWADCQCGHVGTRWDDHVADAVIAELRPQLAAWARLCVDSGDMTPMAQRLLHNILEQS